MNKQDKTTKKTASNTESSETAVTVVNSTAIVQSFNLVNMVQTFKGLTEKEKQANKETITTAVNTIKDSIVFHINQAEANKQRIISIEVSSFEQAVGDLPTTAKNEILGKILNWSLRKDSNIRIVSMDTAKHTLQFAVVEKFTPANIERKVAEKLVSLQ